MTLGVHLEERPREAKFSLEHRKLLGERLSLQGDLLLNRIHVVKHRGSRQVWFMQGAEFRFEGDYQSFEADTSQPRSVLPDVRPDIEHAIDFL